ncbi:MAG: VOC family protein [Balneolaceae bacterium]|nr:VOC family protein [Balneolaceae bacterium]
MKITGILETCIYADDLDKTKHFYDQLPGLEFVTYEPDRHIFYRCGESMLLIFNPAHTSAEQTEVNGNIIPLHEAKGSAHIAFSIRDEELQQWKAFLDKTNISIESEVTWPNGAVSIYFRDPAGNSLEIVSPKIWNS